MGKTFHQSIFYFANATVVGLMRPTVTAGGLRVRRKPPNLRRVPLIVRPSYDPQAFPTPSRRESEAGGRAVSPHEATVRVNGWLGWVGWC